MLYIFLCILSATGIFVVFRFLSKHKIESLPVIVINYFVASIIGFVLMDNNNFFKESAGIPSWLFPSVLIGVLFIVMFFVIARSTSLAGISITTVASKMSVVFPIFFSILIDKEDQISLLKITGVIIALLAVLFTIHQGRNKAERKPGAYLYPLILFVGMGIVDSMVKFSQHHYLGGKDMSSFSAFLFLVAFLTGIVILLFKNKSLAPLFRRRTFLWGVLLGTVNFGSIFFLLKALDSSRLLGNSLDSSVVFGINNTGIVMLSVITGSLVFHERLSSVNKAGIFLSLLAIFIFIYAS